MGTFHSAEGLGTAGYTDQDVSQEPVATLTDPGEVGGGSAFVLLPADVAPVTEFAAPAEDAEDTEDADEADEADEADQSDAAPVAEESAPVQEVTAPMAVQEAHTPRRSRLGTWAANTFVGRAIRSAREQMAAEQAAHARRTAIATLHSVDRNDGATQYERAIELAGGAYASREALAAALAEVQRQDRETAYRAEVERQAAEAENERLQAERREKAQGFVVALRGRAQQRQSEHEANIRQVYEMDRRTEELSAEAARLQEAADEAKRASLANKADADALYATAKGQRARAERLKVWADEAEARRLAPAA